MKSNFKFTNLCGSVYKQGNLVFSPDGNCLYSAVGNRITCFDLVNSSAFTFADESRKNIRTLALSPNGLLLLSVDEDGHANLLNTNRRVCIGSIHFKENIRDAAFSPDGLWLLVTLGRVVQIWKTPGRHRELSPFVLHRTYGGHADDVMRVSWRPDSRAFLTCSRDLTARIFTVQSVADYEVQVLGGHRDALVGAFFANDDGQRIYTVTRDGVALVWDIVETLPERPDLPARYKLTSKHFFNQKHAKAVSACFHRASQVLVVGFSHGLFGMWELPEFSHVQTLSLGTHAITAAAINPSGDWLAFGAAALGQLLVWEWQSESYILKQQGHAYDLTALAISPQGVMATGGDDSKIKLWNETTALCHATLEDHTAPISELHFAKNGRVLFSASLDGTVRAWDLMRYRNFKTYTTPDPAQFGSMAVDESGDLVCAGAVDTFDVYVWAVQTGKLLETLSGHTGPVSSVAFAGTQLVTGSWDTTVRVWNVFERSLAMEAFKHSSEVLAIAVRPDNRHVAAATLDGQIAVWNLSSGTQVQVIDGRKHLPGGRKSTDLVTAENAGAGGCFTTLTYSADGEYLLAGGNSKYVCIYHVASGMLIRRFQISNNWSLEGIKEKLNSRRMTESGTSLDALERNIEDEDRDQLQRGGSRLMRLPGAQRGDLSERSTAPTVHASRVCFSPTDRAWATATSEGLLVYSLDEHVLFDPLELSMDITPQAILEALESDKEYQRALIMALKLNDLALIRQCMESTPVGHIPLVIGAAAMFPLRYVDPLVRALAKLVQDTVHLEFYVEWITKAIQGHLRHLRANSGERPALRLLKKKVREWHELCTAADDNRYMLYFLRDANRKAVHVEEMDEVTSAPPMTMDEMLNGL